MQESLMSQHNILVPSKKESSVPALTAAQRRLHRAALQLFAERGVTHLNVSELAEVAGMARGTVYNNVSDLDGLFSQVAAQFSVEMTERIERSVGQIQDPAQKLANGIRYFTKRAHEDPLWGRFICRFALSSASLQEIWAGQAVKDLREGLEKGRYVFQQEQLASAVTLITGAVLGSILLVLEGRKTWRDAGSDAAQFVLTAIGVPREEARAIANMELPAIPDGTP
jgi:AcrR family transcriptional regulator